MDAQEWEDEGYGFELASMLEDLLSNAGIDAGVSVSLSSGVGLRMAFMGERRVISLYYAGVHVAQVIRHDGHLNVVWGNYMTDREIIARIVTCALSLVEGCAQLRPAPCGEGFALYFGGEEHAVKPYTASAVLYGGKTLTYAYHDTAYVPGSEHSRDLVGALLA